MDSAMHFKRSLLSMIMVTTFSMIGCHTGTKIDPDLRLPYYFAVDGAWCWFSDPRAVYHQGSKATTFAGWVNSAGDIMIGALDHKNGGIMTAVLAEKVDKDDHANPSILIDADGKVMVFYSPHNGREVPITLLKSEWKESITEWKKPRQLFLNENPEYPQDMRRDYCYTNPVRLSDENNRLYLFWRGIGWKPTFSYSDNGGKDWVPGRIMVMPSKSTDKQRPYVKVATNQKDRIHIAFTDGHPHINEHNSIYYVACHDSGFYRVDGTKICNFDEVPFEPKDADRVYDAVATNVRAWIWDVAQDSSGFPVIVYTRLPSKTDHRYHYARWDGERWLDYEIVSGGKWFPQTPEGKVEKEPYYSGGLVLDHENPEIVYLSRPIGGIFEIEKWMTSDGGETWEHQAITTDSKFDNVRPFAIRNAHKGHKPQVLWMENRKYIRYKDFLSTIRLY
jgi:hypothetical protein